MRTANREREEWRTHVGSDPGGPKPVANEVVADGGPNQDENEPGPELEATGNATGNQGGGNHGEGLQGREKKRETTKKSGKEKP